MSKTAMDRMRLLEQILFELMDELRGNGCLAACRIRDWFKVLYPDEWASDYDETQGIGNE